MISQGTLLLTQRVQSVLALALTTLSSPLNTSSSSTGRALEEIMAWIVSGGPVRRKGRGREVGLGEGREKGLAEGRRGREEVSGRRD